jgi:uncharacterized protein YcfL
MKTAWLCLWSVIAAGMAGCISSAPTEVEKHGAEYTVTVNSLILRNHIRVTERSARRTNGLLEAQVRGQNVSRKDVQFEYRFVWLDKDGIKIETEVSTWKQVALHAKESAFMTGISPSPDATDFLMSVRFVHQSTRW